MPINAKNPTTPAALSLDVRKKLTSIRRVNSTPRKAAPQTARLYLMPNHSMRLARKRKVATGKAIASA